MKVKIGARIFDSEEVPIMIICTASDRKQMNDMPPENTKYCQYPSTGYDKEYIEKWMKEV